MLTKPKIKLLIAIAVVLAVIGGGVLVKTLFITKTSTPPPDDVVQEEVTTPVAIETVSTDGWKTCRNEEYGYEFKYPGEWYVHEVVIDSIASWHKQIFECKGPVIVLARDLLKGERQRPPSINVRVYKDNWTGSLEEYLETISTEFSPITIYKKDVIDGVKIILYNKRDSSLQILFSQRGSVLSIRISTQKPYDQVEFSDAVLSTLKFTN